MKNQMDEMQELKLLRLEHNMAWLAFWGLLAVMALQLMLGGVDAFLAILGEWIVFMAMCVYMVAGCLKNGIWDRKLKPDAKTNFRCSLLGAAAVGVVVAVVQWRCGNAPWVIAAVAGVCFLLTLSLCFGALTVAAKLYKKKVKELEDGCGEDT